MILRADIDINLDPPNDMMFIVLPRMQYLQTSPKYPTIASDVRVTIEEKCFRVVLEEKEFSIERFSIPLN